MGAALHDLRSHERWIVLDMKLEQPPRGVPEAADETGRVVDAIQYCDPARPTTFVPMPGNRHRWEFMLMPGDDPATITKPEQIYAMLKPWQHRSGHVRNRARGGLYVSFGALHAVAARSPAARRRCCASDAAVSRPGHVLGASRRRQSCVEARRSDQRRARRTTCWIPMKSERSEHVRAFIELAVELAGVIQTTDPERARARDRELVANPTMLRPITPRLGRGLHGDEPAPAGTRAAQPRLADDTLLDDKVGYRFAVLATPRSCRHAPSRPNASAIRRRRCHGDGDGPCQVLPRGTADRGGGDPSRSPHPRRGVDRSRTRCGSRAPLATLFSRSFHRRCGQCRRLDSRETLHGHLKSPHQRRRSRRQPEAAARIGASLARLGGRQAAVRTIAEGAGREPYAMPSPCRRSSACRL